MFRGMSIGEIIAIGAFILVPILFFAAGFSVDATAVTNMIKGAVPALNGTNVTAYPTGQP